MTAPDDRFDLCARARAGLSFLSRNVDPHRGHLPYFATMFNGDPAENRHDWPDFGDLTARYTEAFVVARRMLGLNEPNDVEVAIRKLLLSYFDEADGLSYRPKPDKPYYSTILRRMYDEHVAEGFDQSRVLWGLAAWCEDSQDPEIRTRIEQLLAGLDRVMVRRDDYGYYDRATWSPGFTPDPDAEPMAHQLYFTGSQIHPLVECYRVLGLERALELAQRLADFVVHHSDYFFEDGSWNCPHGVGFGGCEQDGHTHSRFATIAGVASLGVMTGRDELLQQARLWYDWFVDGHCCSFGWSPEFLGRYGDDAEGCETCAIMDHIRCALVFADAGEPVFYEKAERIARNQLLENQLLDTSLIRNTVEKADTDSSCFHDVAAMVYGGFAGWAGPNDFIGNCKHSHCLMNCCGPSGVRALYDIWDHVYSRDGETLRIHILKDRRDEVLEISNRQPDRGEVSILAKTAGALYLPCRTWTDPRAMQISVNDQPVAAEPQDGYFSVGRLAPGDRVLARYPMDERIERVEVNGRDYRVAWRGDTVVEIDPPGAEMPFYQGRRG